MHPIMVLIIVGLALFAVKYITNAPKAQRPKLLLIAGAGFLLLLAATGKLSPVVAAIAAAVAAGSRLMGLFQTFSGLQGMGQRFKAATSGQSPEQKSKVNTDWMTVELDHDSGHMSGRVLRGRFKGKALADLGEPALLALHAELARADARSCQLLESYMDREISEDWRDKVAGTSAATRGSADMTAAEAREVLGVPDDASEEAIVAAHRKLMQKLHPDRGGSDFLASKVNRAKETLVSKG